ncbi:MAG: TIM barrel protein [Anaerolineaceae bacterium]
MANDIRVGFNIHPRWVQGTTLRAFLSPLKKAGLSVLEFELDNHLTQWEEFEPLMEATVDEGLDISFHAAYRAPHTLVGYASEKQEEIKQDYRPLLQIAEQWAVRLGNPHTVVFHAATAPAPHERAPLIADTVAFLQWVCNEFPHLRIALENNSPDAKNTIKLGIAHEDVLSLVRQIDHPHVGVCWDMGHDAQGNPQVEIEPEWLENVIHVHVHDVDGDGLDHYPLIFGKVPYHDWLTQLKQIGMKGVAVLELKGERMKGWSVERITSVLTQSFSAIAREVK